jgi:nucleoside-diphosphate-sugar epimerase
MVYSLIMSFLVTGGTGFIGSYVIHNLLQHGQRVVCFDRFPDPDVIATFPSEVSVTEGDVSERGQVAAVFAKHPEIDHVVHLAYIMGAESEADPPAAMRVNALGTANVFEEACTRPVARVLFISSESIYGGSQSAFGDRPVTEEDFCAPRGHVLNYSLTKLLNEHLAAKYEDRSRTLIVSLRAAVVYGAGRKRGTTVWASDFATLPALGKPVTLPFPSGDWNCYIYVKDLAEEVYRLSTKSTLTYRIYNSGGHALRAAELAGLVRQIIPEAQISFSPDRPKSPFIYRMEDSRIQGEINFPLRSMSEGIRDHVANAKKSSIAQRFS